MTNNNQDSPEEATGIKLQKSDVEKALLELQAEGKAVPGIMALRNRIGFGSQDRIRRFRDELLSEQGQGPSTENPFNQLSATLWNQMQAKLEEEKEVIQGAADTQIAEIRAQLEAEQAEKEQLAGDLGQVKSDLAGAQEEIERLNRAIVEKDLELTKRTTQLEGKSQQLELMQVQFQEFKALNAEYAKQSAVREQELQRALDDSKRQLINVHSKKEQLLQSLQVWMENRVEEMNVNREHQDRMAEKLLDRVDTVSQSIKDLGEQSTTWVSLIEKCKTELSKELSAFEQSSNRLVKTVIEPVLLIPDVYKAVNRLESLDLIEKKIDSVESKVRSFIKRRRSDNDD